MIYAFPQINIYYELDKYINPTIEPKHISHSSHIAVIKESNFGNTHYVFLHDIDLSIIVFRGAL